MDSHGEPAGTSPGRLAALQSRGRIIRRIEFDYTNLPDVLPAGRYHGALHYRVLPDGRSMLDSWHITSPIAERVELETGDVLSMVVRTVGARSKGGEVVRAIIGADTVHRAHRARLSGIVFDSVGRVPVAGVRVSLIGTGFSTATDSAGRYVLEDLPPGRYRIAFERAESDRLVPLLAPIVLALDTDREREISIIIEAESVSGRIAHRRASRRRSPFLLRES